MWRTVIVNRGERITLSQNRLVVYCDALEQKIPLGDIYALVLVTISWTLFAFTEISKGAGWCKAMLSGVLFGGAIAFAVCRIWDFWK